MESLGSENMQGQNAAEAPPGSHSLSSHLGVDIGHLAGLDDMLNEQFDLAQQLATSTHSSSSMSCIIDEILKTVADDINDESVSEHIEPGRGGVNRAQNESHQPAEGKSRGKIKPKNAAAPSTTSAVPKRPNISVDTRQESAKRPRVSSDLPGGDNNADEVLLSNTPHLTSDLWALVMPYLPYRDVLRCTSANKPFLKDVASRVKEITIMHSVELKVVPARRFAGVEKVTIACLFSVLEGSDGHRVSESETSAIRDEHGTYAGKLFDDTRIREGVNPSVIGLTVPFISSFSSLLEVRVGIFIMNSWSGGKEYRMWYDVDGIDWPNEDDATNETRAMIRSLQYSLCGAYESGSIPPNTRAPQVYCGRDHGTGPDYQACAMCVLRAKCYPLRTIARHPERINPCIREKEILSIILQRTGWREYLESQDFLLEVIGSIELCRYFYDIIKERGLVPAKISREDVLQFTSTRNNKWRATKLRGEHLELLLKLGVPVKASDYVPREIFQNSF